MEKLESKITEEEIESLIYELSPKREGYHWVDITPVYVDGRKDVCAVQKVVKSITTEKGGGGEMETTRIGGNSIYLLWRPTEKGIDEMRELLGLDNWRTSSTPGLYYTFSKKSEDEDVDRCIFNKTDNGIYFLHLLEFYQKNSKCLWLKGVLEDKDDIIIKYHFICDRTPLSEKRISKKMLGLK